MTRHVQLNPVDHGTLRVRTERGRAFGDNIMSCPIFSSEMRHVQAHYPIVFTKESRSGRFRPIALFGVEQGQNLFLTKDGWDAHYLPMAMRMQPFLIGFTRGSGGPSAEVHIDLDHVRVTEEGGEAVFLEDGTPTPYLNGISDLLAQINAAEGTLDGFCALLTEFNLLEPFSLDMTLETGEQGRLAGYYLLNEERLQSLSDAHLSRLHAAAALLPCYMMVASYAQFSALVARRNASAQLEAGHGG